MSEQMRVVPWLMRVYEENNVFLEAVLRVGGPTNKKLIHFGMA